jgi:uncharacterized membrane protein
MPEGQATGVTTSVHGLIEAVSLGVELLAIAVIVVAIVYGTLRYLSQVLGRERATGAEGAYESYRERLGRALLLGLEILVAADVIRTVALEPTLTSIAVLGLLVVIRTFLSWSLVVEIEGRWPWQAGGRRDGAA